MGKQTRVFVAMSGGVDSSVAALLLKNKGYDVVGVFMRCYNLDGCAERDATDARRVAEHLGIPFYVWDFEEEYKKRVVGYMIEGYRKGITPNPDVMCNKEIKFGLFLEKALAMGADYVATGHYVRLGRIYTRRRRDSLPASESASLSPQQSRQRRDTKLLGLRDAPQDKAASPALGRNNVLSETISGGEVEIDERVEKMRGRPLAKRAGQHFLVRSESNFSSRSGLRKEYFALLEAEDQNKDQSYFLWTLTQEQLKHCLFPIGDYLKSEVRAMAREAGLPTADKKDSQGICFLGKVTLADFLKQYIPEKRGAVLTVSGEKVGEHPGAEFFTIGQRHGLGIGGGNAYYVAGKDVRGNMLVVAEGNEHPALYRKEMQLRDVNFITQSHSNIPRNIGIRVLARVRYRQPLSKAVLIITDEDMRLVFDQPQKFVAAGQSAVFYSKAGELLGGGIIL